MHFKPERGSSWARRRPTPEDGRPHLRAAGARALAANDLPRSRHAGPAHGTGLGEAEPRRLRRALQRHSARNGPPTRYTEELDARICGQLETGRSLQQVCRGEGDAGSHHGAGLDPARSPWFRRTLPCRARIGCYTLFDEMQQIADDDSGDWYLGRDGRVMFNPQNVARARLRIITRRRLFGDSQPTNREARGSIELRSGARQVSGSDGRDRGGGGPRLRGEGVEVSGMFVFSRHIIPTVSSPGLSR